MVVDRTPARGRAARRSSAFRRPSTRRGSTSSSRAVSRRRVASCRHPRAARHVACSPFPQAARDHRGGWPGAEPPPGARPSDSTQRVLVVGAERVQAHARTGSRARSIAPAAASQSPGEGERIGSLAVFRSGASTPGRLAKARQNDSRQIPSPSPHLGRRPRRGRPVVELATSPVRPSSHATSAPAAARSTIAPNSSAGTPTARALSTASRASGSPRRARTSASTSSASWCGHGESRGSWSSCVAKLGRPGPATRGSSIDRALMTARTLIRHRSGSCSRQCSSAAARKVFASSWSIC